MHECGIAFDSKRGAVSNDAIFNDIKQEMTKERGERTTGYDCERMVSMD